MHERMKQWPCFIVQAFVRIRFCNVQVEISYILDVVRQNLAHSLKYKAMNYIKCLSHKPKTLFIYLRDSAYLSNYQFEP